MAMPEVVKSAARRGLSVRRVSHGLDRVGVDFDDESLVANAALVLIATMAAPLLGLGVMSGGSTTTTVVRVRY
jgi:hypothetical protein